VVFLKGFVNENIKFHSYPSNRERNRREKDCVARVVIILAWFPLMMNNDKRYWWGHLHL